MHGPAVVGIATALMPQTPEVIRNICRAKRHMRKTI